MAQLFAAEHPTRVDRLVLLNTRPGRAGMIAVHQGPDGSLDSLERKFEIIDRMIATWGTDPQYSVELLLPVELGQRSVRALVRAFGTAVPDRCANAAGARQRRSPDGRRRGRWVAEWIPDARFVEVPGRDHFVEPTPHWQQFTDTWLEFVTGSRRLHHSERRLMTVVFTDIVDSTSQTEAVGDGPWRRLLDGHDRLAWEIIDRHRGTIVKSTGDGVLARFDAPSHAPRVLS
jgi:hypothetical protein